MKVKLARALKEKNRLVGEVNRLKKLFERENSRLEDSKSTIDRQKVWDDLSTAMDKLIQVKASIFLANAGIYEKIIRMGELKSLAQWVPCIPNSEDSQQTPVRDGNGISYKEVKRNAFLNQERTDDKVVEMQNLIASLQDEIDEFNATVTVEIP